MARSHFDSLRAHAFGHEAFEVRINYAGHNLVRRSSLRSEVERLASRVVLSRGLNQLWAAASHAGPK